MIEAWPDKRYNGIDFLPGQAPAQLFSRITENKGDLCILLPKVSSADRPQPGRHLHGGIQSIGLRRDNHLQ